MARTPPDAKKLISLTEQTRGIRERIVQISLQTGLTESRIIEDCIICGFGFLYGSKDDVPEVISVMQQRHINNLFDLEKLRKWIEQS